LTVRAARTFQSHVPCRRSRWLRAVTFTVSLARQHLRDDPARLPLLALRLMPGPLRCVVRAAATRAGGTARAYALWDQGKRAKAREAGDFTARGAPRRPVGRLVAVFLRGGTLVDARD